MLLKYGHITNYNDDNHVIVKLDDADGVTTDYIPFLVHNPCFEVEPIVLNALVAVLIDDSGQDGVCLGYVSSQKLSKGKTFITGDINVVGNITVVGNISDIYGSMKSMREVYNSHTHPDNGSKPPSNLMTISNW